ncbi:MAG: hypothetical protein KC983_02015 [Phycisphaerales bacterium]|nr:hypothetical protein [Phycisphaerales bacterium]
MLTVTESARSHLAGALDKIDAPKPDNACFRIVPRGDGKLALTVDAPAPDDTKVEHAGTTVLVLADDIRERCEGRTLDAVDGGNLVLT